MKTEFTADEAIAWLRDPCDHARASCYEVGCDGPQLRGIAATIDRLRAQLAAAERDRDEARNTLADLVSWFDAPPSPPEWRIPAGEHGADDAVQHARDILALAPQTPSEGGR